MTQKKTILIVEDEILLANILTKEIQDKGFNTITTNNGKQALNALQTTNIDLILLDMLMPIMDGEAFLKKLTDQQIQNIPIIILTNLSQTDLPRFIKEALLKSQTTLEEIITKIKKYLS